MKYYEVRNLLANVPDATFYIIIGQRANGKSTSVGKFLIDECIQNNTSFAYFTRLQNISIIKDTEEGNGYFSGFLEQYALHTYNRKIHVKDNSIYIGENMLCKQFAISLSGKYKSKQYAENYKYILFEEFVSEDGIYIRNEWQRFNSIISTIVRNRDAKVFLIGNTVSRFNPYFENFGIDVTNLNIKAGEYRIINTNTGAKVVIEYCDNVYENDKEIANILKVNNNAIATSTEWLQSNMVLNTDIIEKLQKQYKIAPICIIVLQDDNKAHFYYMYSLSNNSRHVCNLITDSLLVDINVIDELDYNDIVYYIDVEPVECIANGVKSFVDLQKFTKSSPELIKTFNQVTYYSDDKIRHYYTKVLQFKDPSAKVGVQY